jgi:hypothetical protein
MMCQNEEMDLTTLLRYVGFLKTVRTTDHNALSVMKESS